MSPTTGWAVPPQPQPQPKTCIHDDVCAQRFWDRVDMTAGLFGCWPWLGSHHQVGYGWFWCHGRNRNAHRVAFELANGPIAAGMFVMHICDNPPCVNPAHLAEGSPADNMRDKATKGRAARPAGELHPLARLSESDVLAIRSRAERGDSDAAIAEDYPVTKDTVFAVRTRKRWSHLP